RWRARSSANFAPNPWPVAAGCPGLRRPSAHPPSGAPMSEALPFKTTMNFAYGEPGQLAPGIVRIVANSPNHFTFKGTNTYLVGSRTLALIDPGPADPAHP